MPRPLRQPSPFRYMAGRLSTHDCMDGGPCVELLYAADLLRAVDALPDRLMLNQRMVARVLRNLSACSSAEAERTAFTMLERLAEDMAIALDTADLAHDLEQLEDPDAPTPPTL